MKKEFIYNIFFLIVTNLIVKPFYIFGIETRVQNALGPDSYGLYFSLFGLVFLFQFINEPGLQNNNAVFISQNRDKVSSHIQKLLGLKIELLLLFLTISIFVSVVIGHNALSIKYTFGIVLIFFLSTLYVLLRSSLSSLGKYRIDTWLSSLDKLLLIIALGFILISDYNLSIETFIIVQIICYVICNLIVLFFLMKQGISIVPKFDNNYNLSFLKSSLPFALIILLTAVITRSDGVLLERLLSDGEHQSGLYSAGYRFVDAANMFGLLFGALLLPMYGNNISSKSKINDLFDISFRVLFILSLLIASILYFFSEEIIRLFYSEDYLAAIPSMKILMLSVIPIIFTHAFGALIMTHGKIKSFNKTLLIIAIISLILNYTLIINYKTIGAATTTVLSQYLILVGMLIIIIKYKLVEITISILLKCLVFLCLTVLVFYFTKSIISVQWIAQIFISTSISILIALTIRLINIKSDFRSLN